MSNNPHNTSKSSRRGRMRPNQPPQPYLTQPYSAGPMNPTWVHRGRGEVEDEMMGAYERGWEQPPTGYHHQGPYMGPQTADQPMHFHPIASSTSSLPNYMPSRPRHPFRETTDENPMGAPSAPCDRRGGHRYQPGAMTGAFFAGAIDSARQRHAFRSEGRQRSSTGSNDEADERIKEHTP